MRSRSLLYDAFGSPWEKLKLISSILAADVPDNMVRIRFLASPINPSDLNQIEGTYPVRPAQFPAVGGNEGVALVEDIGKGVTGLKAGDLVIPARTAIGSWRDFGYFDAGDFTKIPEKWSKLSLEVLATLNVNPPTAYRLLKDFVHLGKGNLVVQNGANSAVGRLVIQMTSIMGARTLNIVRDRPDFDALAQELSSLDPCGGATVVKAEEMKEIQGKYKADLGLNCVGGGAVSDMSKVMKSDGTIVTYGAMSRRPVQIPAAPLIFQNLTFKGFWVTAWYKKTAPDSPERSEMLENILTWYADVRLTPVKSFFIDVVEGSSDVSEAEIKEFMKDSCEGKVMNKGKCILRFI